MPYHSWYDEEDDFDFGRLNEAGFFIHKYCIKRARLYIHWKEKYGTLRYEYINSCLFGFWPIHHIFKPACLRYQWTKWVMNIDIVLGRLLEFIGVAPLVRRYQLYIFRKALFAAVKKYPDMEDEILSDAPEEVIGEEIHSRYWT